MGTAPDFTVTDIDGQTHHLYGILDQGYVVVLDASATWCGTCWSVHNANYLNDLNTQMGPTGTNQIRVIFYEADATTNTADLNGTGSNTQGDWVTDANYPIVDESAPLSLSGSVYWPDGFPTISVIRPADREITADVWNQNLAGMVSAVNNAIATNPASISSDFLSEHGISIFPNPATDHLAINLGTANDLVDVIVIRNAMGQSIRVIPTSRNQRLDLTVSDIAFGAYILEFQSQGSVMGVQKFMKN